MKFAYMDCEKYKEDCRKLKIKSYPSIYYVKNETSAI